MLKKTTRVLFLGFVVLAGSACVTPTHASSAAGIVMTYIQASGVGGAKEEVIALHNNTHEEIEITDWCLVNRSGEKFACFASRSEQYPGLGVRYVVPPYADILVASSEYVLQAGLTADYFSLVYTVTNQSRGSMVGSSDTMQLVDSKGDVVEEKAWSVAAPAGKALARKLAFSSPVVYATSDEAGDWSGAVAWFIPPQSLLQTVFEEIGPEIPTNPEPPEIPEQVPTIPVLSQPSVVPLLTEIFANPKGSDDGHEFIELYNPSDTLTIDLQKYKLRMGIDSIKWYTFPADALIKPLQYQVFSDSEIGFSLLNGDNVIQLFYEDMPIGDPVRYSSPKDDMSWSLIDGTWRYVSKASPTAANFADVVANEAVKAAVSDASAQKPCALNQYRSPDTGRCRLIAASASTPATCKQGQERNPETGRCRNVAAANVPAPCKEGQERNAETNRCRAIVKMSNAGSGVKGVQLQPGNQPSWYYIATIALIILAILAYAVWEWRVELRQIWLRVRRRFAK